MWKKVLLGIVIFIVGVIVLALVLTKSISEVANKQLLALSQNDIITAYAYTSKEFRAETSLAAFEQFVDQYPVLKHHKNSSWNEREFFNNTASLKGIVTAEDGAIVPVEYRFVKENDEWKIVGMLIKPSEAKQPQEALHLQNSQTAKSTNVPVDMNQTAGEIYQVLVSDTQGQNGSVDMNKAVIAATSPKVFVSVYILHAKEGLKVMAEFVRLKNGAKIGPSTAVVSKSGDIIRDFSFTNTAAQWPKGKYRINVTTSNKQGASTDFTIE